MRHADFFAFLDSLPDAAVVVDLDQNVLFANEQLCRLLCYPPENLQGKPLGTLLHTSTGSLSTAALLESRISAGSAPGLLTFRTSAGTCVVASVRTSDVQIDGRRALLATLRQTGSTTFQDFATKARLQAKAIATWEIGIYEHDHLSGAFYGCSRLRELYGFTEEEELTIESFGAAFYPADRDRMLAAIARAHDPNGDGGFDALHRIVRVDGALRWLHTRAHTTFATIDGTRQPVLTTGSLMDMTEREIAEEDRQRRSAILDATPDFVSITDVEGNLVYINKAGRSFLGIGIVEDISNRKMVSNHPEPTLALIRDVGIPTAMRTGSWKAETEFISRDNRTIPMSHVILAHRGADGNVEYLSTIARDLSREKTLEEQFRQAQKMEAIGCLAGGVAHDFNNLLSVILGFAALASSRIESTHAAKNDLREVSRAAERASALTRQLLAFGRKQVLQPRVVDLNELIGSMDPMLRRLVNENIRMIVNPCSDAMTIKADPNQIEQILLNLIINSRDAMPNGGSLSVKTEVVTLDDLAIATELSLAPGSYAVVIVSDTGQGMDAETQRRAFEPFFTTKGPGEGTGLGLSTVFGIVRQSGGSLKLESKQGQGTSFHVYFPFSDEPIYVPKPSDTPFHPTRGEVILVAEDDAQLRAMVVRSLSEAGYTVLRAADPVEALMIAREFEGRIDLLLTDVLMPKMNGKQLADELLQQRPETAVLFMSGYTGDTIVLSGVLNDDVNFLAKPVTPGRLLTAIQEVLSKSAIDSAN